MRTEARRSKKGAVIARPYPTDKEATMKAMEEEIEGEVVGGKGAVGGKDKAGVRTWLGTVDWDRVKEQYISGDLSIKQIAVQNGIREVEINDRAAVRGWKRNLGGQIVDTTKALLQEGSTVDVENEYDPLTQRDEYSDRVVLSAARQAVAVIQGHRNRLSRLGRIADLFLVKMEAIAENLDTDPFMAMELRSTLLGPHETLFDAQVKLTNAIAKAIPLERQAFDLDGDRHLKALSDEELLKRACGEDALDRLHMDDDEELDELEPVPVE